MHQECTWTSLLLAHCPDVIIFSPFAEFLLCSAHKELFPEALLCGYRRLSLAPARLTGTGPRQFSAEDSTQEVVLCAGFRLISGYLHLALTYQRVLIAGLSPAPWLRLSRVAHLGVYPVSPASGAGFIKSPGPLYPRISRWLVPVSPGKALDQGRLLHVHYLEDLTSLRSIFSILPVFSTW